MSDTHSDLQSIDSEAQAAHEHPVELAADQEEKPTSRIASLSKTSSVKFDKSKIVPKSQRRGMFAYLLIIPEYDNPRDLPPMIKYIIVFNVAFCAMMGPMGTSILLPASDSLIEDLHTSVTIVNISIGIYLISLGVFPLWWSSFSERHGRRNIYLISFIFYLGFSIGCAMSKSIGMLIGFRVLSGACTASVQAVGAGSISDLYPIEKRGAAMGIFYLGSLAAPLISPIVGGAISERKSWGWRATQWFLVILAGVCVILLLFCQPETLRLQDNKDAVRKLLRERLKKSTDEESQSHDEEQLEQEVEKVMTRLSRQNTQINEDPDPVDMNTPIGRVQTSHSQNFNTARLEKIITEAESMKDEPAPTRWQKFKTILYIYGYSPLRSFAFLRYPPVFLAIAYSAPCFAILYCLNMTLTYCYSRPPYNFDSLLVGLVYIPNSVTYIIASIWGGRFTDYLLEKKRQKYGVLAPEARFGINMYVAAAIFPCALLIIGWCLDKKEHWVTPLVGTALFGFAQMIVIGTVVTYIADSLPGKGATGIALSNFIRMIMAAGISFATEPLIRALGVGVLFSILAGVTIPLSLVIVIIKLRGDHWRETFELEKLYDIADG
ncbi:hypothetical protein OGAPHI_004489 [Ogataea philodendri]|uniref:Major facilitator superfamily (MFS) profile domain-containing protein n=1 Tax=Ogataea philodendri TaxID=1378263 RepID=A0A9P8P6T2_9ASCO|nr:uncharacterized protein OGAPHI_004489 [Ogataea philodendri]KAH3666300.1 hypothetical protein OGAPHI_004489 [Ogataea philodendri]